MKILNFLLLVVFGAIYLPAVCDELNPSDQTVAAQNQAWSLVGEPYISKGTTPRDYIINLSLKVSQGIPYVMCQSGFLSSNSCRVLRLSGSKWEDLGELGLNAADLKMDVWNGTPIVAYTDNDDSYKVHVLKYSGKSWVALGGPATDKDTGRFSLKIRDGMPFLVYENNHRNFGQPLDLKKDKAIKVTEYENGEWTQLGDPAVSEVLASVDFSFDVHQENPYVFFQDGVMHPTVLNYIGSAWAVVGKKEFNENLISYPVIFVDKATPYVSFSGYEKTGKITVMKFDGKQWVIVGNPGFSDGIASRIELSIHEGTPYVIYFDSTDGAAVAKKFNGKIWETIGTRVFGDTGITDYTFGFDGDIPYVAYVDSKNMRSFIVEKLR